jgi:elongation factor 1-alpha
VMVPCLSTPKYSEGWYEEMVKQVTPYLKKIGYSLNETPFNIIEHSTNLDWYKGSTLLEALDLIKEPKRPLNKPL